MPTHKQDARRIGLARALSKLGFASRAQSAELVRAGKVSVNGQVRRNPESPVNLAADRIAVAGFHVAAAERRYIMLNKPRGVVTTRADERGRATVYSLLDESLPYLAPVGRLDQASEGLLLLTNDSEWAARISAPESQVAKTYHVHVESSDPEGLCDRLLAGVASRGEELRARSARVLRRANKTAWLEIVLDEGRNRQIRRMLEALGVAVLRLVRVAIGPLELGELPKGKWCELTDAEVARLSAKAKTSRSDTRSTN